MNLVAFQLQLVFYVISQFVLMNGINQIQPILFRSRCWMFLSFGIARWSNRAILVEAGCLMFITQQFYQQIYLEKFYGRLCKALPNSKFSNKVHSCSRFMSCAPRAFLVAYHLVNITETVSRFKHCFNVFIQLSIKGCVVRGGKVIL